MKTLLKYLSFFVIAVITAFGAVYMNENCPKRQEKEIQKINQIVENYINTHSKQVLENIAKNEEFSNVVRNLAPAGDMDITNSVQRILEENPNLLENHIRNNASFIASAVLETGELSNVKEQPQEQQEAVEQTNENQKFIDHWEELIGSPVAPNIGPKDAKVTIVEFFDFGCGHCKALAPIIALLIKNNPDVRFVFNPLFFISSTSPYAAKVAMAAYTKGKFTEVYEGILTLPQLTEDAVNQIVTDEGLDLDEIKKMVEEKNIRRGLQDIDSLSQVLDVNGVPLLLINGEPANTRDINELQKIINKYKSR